MSWRKRSGQSWGQLGMNYKLSEIMDILGGGTPKTSRADYWNGDIPWLSVKDFNNDYRYVYESEKTITEAGLNNSSTQLLQCDDIIISARGTVGAMAMIPFPMAFNQSCYGLRGKPELVDQCFLYYLVKHNVHVLQKNTHGSVFDTITRDTFAGIEVDVPALPEQRAIAAILRILDDKIELNNRINENLEQQAQDLYRELFVDKPDAISAICRAEEFFDISIGKTPPRKEPQWFTHDPDEVTWVSIADMGKSGLYISESSEQLTKEAVSRFNVKVVPSNTVLLSFKLTVGRVAITDGEMTTNEAIAHFVTQKPEIIEYLYCYLKDFNYQTMGSTSSIATAVNSKIIKAMPFQIPEQSLLEKYHSVVSPMFAKIKTNQTENKRLATIRDSLLPKLMSGELDVSEIDL